MIFVLYAIFKVENIFPVILVNLCFTKSVVNILQNHHNWIYGNARNVLRLLAQMNVPVSFFKKK